MKTLGRRQLTTVGNSMVGDVMVDIILNPNPNISEAFENKMSFLFQIPEDISINVLSQWCELNDLGLLDTACCFVEGRINLLQIFCSPGFILQAIVTLKGIQFCSDKRMTMNSILLCQKDFKANRNRNIVIDRLNTQKVTKLRIVKDCSYEHNNETIFFCYQLANRCCALEKIMLFGCGDHVDMFVTSLSIAILRNLKVFSSTYGDLGIKSYKYLAENSICLESLSVEHNYTDTPELDIQSLIVGIGRNLKKISFYDYETTILTNKTLQCVMAFCPGIEKLKLSLNNELAVSLSLVNQLLTKCTALKVIIVGSIESKISLAHRNNKTYIAIKDPLITNEHELIQFFTKLKQNDMMKLHTVPLLSAITLNTIALHNCTSLKQLYIVDCSLITTADVIKLINALPKLTKLSVSRCSLVDQQEVEKYLEERKRKQK